MCLLCIRLINLYLSQENHWNTSQHKVLYTEDAVTCCDCETVMYLESSTEHWLYLLNKSKHTNKKSLPFNSGLREKTIKIAVS